MGFRAQVGGLNQLHDDFAEHARFAFVYVREAFPADARWPAPVPDGALVVQPTTMSERCDNATRCLDTIDIRLPCLIDNLNDTAARTYDAFPFRLYLVDATGTVAVASEKGAAGFEAGLVEARAWLEKHNTRPSDGFESFFATIHAQKKFHGNVLVAERGEIIFQGSFGLADDVNETPLTADSKFELASVSKPITALGVLVLVERDELDLDAAITTVLPEFPYDGITVRHLLTHTSGMMNHHGFFRRYAGRIQPGQVVTNADVMTLLQDEAPDVVNDPGAQFDYNNINYIVLAQVIEAVSNQPFATFMKADVFDPAGMEDTRVRVGNDTDDLVVDYVRPITDVGWSRRSKTPGWGFVDQLGGTVGDGSIFSTTGDLLKLDNALRAGQIVRPETLDLAYTPGTLADRSTIENRSWTVSSYGLGWRLSLDGREAWHTGDWGGYLTNWKRYLETDRVIIYLQNRRSDDWSWIMDLEERMRAPELGE